MTLSRRDVFTRGGALGIGAAAGLPFAAGSLAAPRRQEGNTKVIFFTHDDNPFFVPVRAGLEQFGALAGWETQWIGPPKHDEVATLQYQLDAIAAKPAAVGFTRVNTTQFDDAIRSAQDEGIFVILYNTASEGYQDLGVAYVGQEFIPSASVRGRNRSDRQARRPVGGGGRRHRRVRPRRLRALAHGDLDRAGGSAGQVRQRRLRPRSWRAGRHRERIGPV